MAQVPQGLVGGKTTFLFRSERVSEKTRNYEDSIYIPDDFVEPGNRILSAMTIDLLITHYFSKEDTMMSGSQFSFLGTIE